MRGLLIWIGAIGLCCLPHSHSMCIWPQVTDLSPTAMKFTLTSTTQLSCNVLNSCPGVSPTLTASINMFGTGTTTRDGTHMAQIKYAVWQPTRLWSPASNITTFFRIRGMECSRTFVLGSSIGVCVIAGVCVHT